MSAKCFKFGSFSLDLNDFEADFRYHQQGMYGGRLDIKFTERVQFVKPESGIKFSDFSPERQKLLHQAMELAHIIIGVSYYKVRPTIIDGSKKDDTSRDFRDEFFGKIYQEGLSQFAYENHLTRADLKAPSGTIISGLDTSKPIPVEEKGILTLQSGGKDSILTAALLNEKKIPWTALYISSSEDSNYPEIINLLGAKKVQVIRRIIDQKHLKEAAELGGLNGHVPVTYINMALALIQAIINGDNVILTSIGHEGEEPHAMIGDLPVNHQWSKTWEAEQLFAKYITDYISRDIKIGSLLRQYSELKIAELFAKKCWEKYGRIFSSCNLANYTQSADNTNLHWCGKCAKCANSYLLFAPFVEPEELNLTVAGNSQKSLFSDPDLTEIFKGLLGVDNIIKPFECVGEVAELRQAYHLKKSGYPDLVFDVPESDYNYNQTFPHQDINLAN